MGPIENGQTVYHNNEPVRYVTAIDSERALIAVSIGGADDYGDYFSGEQHMVVAMHTLHDKKTDLFAEVKARKAQLREEVDALVLERREVEASLEAAKERAKQIPALKNLFAFIDGKITHFVTGGFYPSIVPFDEFRCGYSNGKMRLLSLFGGTNGDLLWKVNQYSDGSGSDNLAMPCLSYEEAQATLLRVVEEYIADKGHIGESQEKLLAEHHIDPSPAVQAAIDARHEAIRGNVVKKIAKLEGEVAKLQESIETPTQEQPPCP